MICCAEDGGFQATISDFRALRLARTCQSPCGFNCMKTRSNSVFVPRSFPKTEVAHKGEDCTACSLSARCGRDHLPGSRLRGQHEFRGFLVIVICILETCTLQAFLVHRGFCKPPISVGCWPRFSHSCFPGILPATPQRLLGGTRTWAGAVLL